MLNVMLQYIKKQINLLHLMIQGVVKKDKAGNFMIVWQVIVLLKYHKLIRISKKEDQLILLIIHAAK
jgi:hypothetical protein